jgi:hypothetical protein
VENGPFAIRFSHLLKCLTDEVGEGIMKQTSSRDDAIRKMNKSQQVNEANEYNCIGGG